MQLPHAAYHHSQGRAQGISFGLSVATSPTVCNRKNSGVNLVCRGRGRGKASRQRRDDSTRRVPLRWYEKQTQSPTGWHSCLYTSGQAPQVWCFVTRAPTQPLSGQRKKRLEA